MKKIVHDETTRLGGACRYLIAKLQFFMEFSYCAENRLSFVELIR